MDIIKFLLYIIGASVALTGIIFAWFTAKRRATLDLILKTESDKHYKDEYEGFSNHVKSPNSLLSQSMNDLLAVDWTDEDTSSERRKFIGYLNHNELISIGIAKGILDNKMYSSWMRTAFCQNYLESFDYIYFTRNFDLSKNPVSLLEKRPNDYFIQYGMRATTWMNAEEKLLYFKKLKEADQAIKDFESQSQA